MVSSGWLCDCRFLLALAGRRFQERLHVVRFRQQVHQPLGSLRRDRGQAGDLARPLLGLGGQRRVGIVGGDPLVVVAGRPILGPAIVILGQKRQPLGLFEANLGRGPLDDTRVRSRIPAGRPAASA